MARYRESPIPVGDLTFQASYDAEFGSAGGFSTDAASYAVTLARVPVTDIPNFERYVLACTDPTNGGTESIQQAYSSALPNNSYALASPCGRGCYCGPLILIWRIDVDFENGTKIGTRSYTEVTSPEGDLLYIGEEVDILLVGVNFELTTCRFQDRSPFDKTNSTVWGDNPVFGPCIPNGTFEPTAPIVTTVNPGGSAANAEFIFQFDPQCTQFSGSALSVTAGTVTIAGAGDFTITIDGDLYFGGLPAGSVEEGYVLTQETNGFRISYCGPLRRQGIAAPTWTLADPDNGVLGATILPGHYRYITGEMDETGAYIQYLSEGGGLRFAIEAKARKRSIVPDDYPTALVQENPEFVFLTDTSANGPLEGNPCRGWQGGGSFERVLPLTGGHSEFSFTLS